MSKLKGIIRKMSGSVGDLTFKNLNGSTVVSEKVTTVANPRTNKQMRVRTKWANIVAMYKGIRPLINYGFENRPCNLTDYNMFVKVNMQLSGVYLTKQQVTGGACVAAPYQITQGSLPAIVITGEGRNATTNIFIADITLSASTTVGEFSKAVVDNNPDYKYGDQISYFIIKQKVNEATGIPYCQFKANAVVLDAANEEKLWEIVPKNGFSAQDGCIGHSGNDGDCVFCWVHSRKSNGKTLVSSQMLINANSKIGDYQGDMAYSLAASSYGSSKVNFLSPDAEPADNSAGTGTGGSGSAGSGDSL